jgi:hypothetical protein
LDLEIAARERVTFGPEYGLKLESDPGHSRRSDRVPMTSDLPR